jgi:tRNA-2-methylthio-N6-dimethylallyladenosine synthase
VAQQRGEALLKSMPGVDLVVGPDNIAELPELLVDVEHGAPPRARTVFDTDNPRFLKAEPREGRTGVTAFVTIMKGCNERCSFCIVPTTRGPERYRPARDVLDEVARLVDAGVKEVTLLGQTVNSYTDPDGSFDGITPMETRGRPSADDTQFPELLHAIANRVPMLRRLRYTSPHPRHLTPSLIRAHAELSVLAKHVHMPVQSGSDRMLKRMIRRYSVEEYVERIAMLREHVRGVTVSTDVIVGFPGETREDFEGTLALVERVGFAGLFGFKYSERPGTPAIRLGDDVPESEKESRLAELFAVAGRLREQHLESLVGSHVHVLVEGRSTGESLTGRSERNEIVHIKSGSDLTGEIVEVEVLRAFKNSLEGALVHGDSPRTAPRGSEPNRRALPMVQCR